MNAGIFGEGFPYSNFHDLNMDWIIKIAKDFLDQYTHIQEIIEQGKTDIETLTDTGLTELQDKADALEQALQAWYNEHSEDIANQLVQALEDLQTALTNAVSSFNTQAQQIGQQVIASIPDDYTALSQKVTTLDTAVNAYWMLSDTASRVTYNYSTKVLTIPAHTFCIYKGVPAVVSNDVVLDLSSILQSGACNLWMKSDHTVFAYNFAQKPSDADALYLGSVYYKYVHINGLSDEFIYITGDGLNNSMFPNNMGSFIGIETEVRKVVVDITSKLIKLPGGFKVYRGHTSPYSAENISYTNTTANKIWMKNDFTVYTTDWNDNNIANPDDDCIGFRYGDTVKIAGIPDYDILVTNNANEVIPGTGLTFGGAIIGIHELQEATYNYDTKVLFIPQGFYLYRGVAQTRLATTLDLTNYLLNEACILYLTRTGSIYAKKWSSRLLENPTDSLLGYVYGKVVIINGIDKKRISIFDSNSTVYCFGDSIPAGTGTTKNFLQFLHEFNRDLVFKNYCVGSTGYLLEANGTVIAGNGGTGNGTSTAETGNNNVYKKMQTVTDTMKNILISAGTNDWATNQVLNDVRIQVINAINYAKESTVNVFILLPIKREGWATNTNTLGLTLKDYSDMIKAECISRGVVYFDGYDVFIDPSVTAVKTALVPDGLHPNIKGHWRIANAINNTVKQAMNNPDT